MNRRAITAISLVAAASLALAGCGSSGSSSESSGSGDNSTDPIKIGAVLSLTGGAASYGEMAKGGLDLGVAEINAAGGVNGRPLEILYEDNQLQPATAATAAQKLTGEGVKVIFTHGSSITAAITKVTEGQDVILPNIAAQSDVVTAAEQVYSFIPTNSMELGHLADLAKSRGAKTLAVIHSDDDYGKSASNAVIEAFEAGGGTVVANESHPPGTTDMRTQLIKIQAAAPDATAVLSNTGEIAHIVKQARELGLAGDVMGADSALSPSEFTTAGDAYNGFIGVAIRFDQEKNADAKAFAEKFEAEVGKPPNNYAAIAYEGIKLVAEGMKSAGGDDPQKIGAYLLTVKNVEGTLGTMSFLPNRVIEFPYYEWIIKDGAVTPLT